MLLWPETIPHLPAIFTSVARPPGGRLLVDQLGTSNLAPLVVNGQINGALAASHVRVIKDTHGKTSQLSQSDIDALTMYLMSLQ